MCVCVCVCVGAAVRDVRELRCWLLRQASPSFFFSKREERWLPVQAVCVSLSLSFFVQLDETQTLNGKTVLEKVGAREGYTGVYNEGHMSAAGR